VPASIHRALSSQTSKPQTPGSGSKPAGEPAACNQVAQQPGTDVASQTATRRARRSEPQSAPTSARRSEPQLAPASSPLPSAAPETSARVAERVPSEGRDDSDSDSDVCELVAVRICSEAEPRAKRACEFVAVDRCSEAEPRAKRACKFVRARRCSEAEPRAKWADHASSPPTTAGGNPHVFVVVDDDSDDHDAAPKPAMRTAKSEPASGLAAVAGQSNMDTNQGVVVAAGVGAGCPQSPLGNAAAAAGQVGAASRPSCATLAVAAGEPAAATATDSPGVAGAAVAENQGIADLVGELECIVCFELLAAPAALGCGHTFCRPCLARVLQECV
jgi:hypothetical protein